MCNPLYRHKEGAATETTALADGRDGAAGVTSLQNPRLPSAAVTSAPSPAPEHGELPLRCCPLISLTVFMNHLRATVYTKIGQELGSSAPFNQSNALSLCC